MRLNTESVQSLEGFTNFLNKAYYAEVCGRIDERNELQNGTVGLNKIGPKVFNNLNLLEQKMN